MTLVIALRTLLTLYDFVSFPCRSFSAATLGLPLFVVAERNTISHSLRVTFFMFLPISTSGSLEQWPYPLPGQKLVPSRGHPLTPTKLATFPPVRISLGGLNGLNHAENSGAESKISAVQKPKTTIFGPFFPIPGHLCVRIAAGGFVLKPPSTGLNGAPARGLPGPSRVRGVNLSGYGCT